MKEAYLTKCFPFLRYMFQTPVLFRKGFSTQQRFLTLLEKCKNSVDKGKIFSALLTGFSKAFDSLNHELLIAKLNIYGFTLSVLKLIQNYLSNRKQRVRVNDSYSLWQDILFGVPQGSILKPFLFNLLLADLFFTQSSTDNFLTLISVYNCFIIHCRNLIFYQKKK